MLIEMPNEYITYGKAPDLTGQRFGKLLVLSRLANNSKGQVIWLCVCECGARVPIKNKNIKSGKAKDCGACSLYKSAITHIPFASRDAYEAYLNDSSTVAND
jgi:hypothetical protein